MNPILGYSSDRSVYYIKLPHERIPEARKLLEQHFFPHGCMLKAFEVYKNPKAMAEMSLLAAECFKDDASIAAIESNSNKMVGCSINTFQTKSTSGEKSHFDIFAQKHCQQKESINLINVLASCISHVNIFDVLKIEKVLEITFLVTSSEYRRKGIGTDLIEYDLKLLEQLKSEDHGPQAAMALFTSNYSQKIGEKLNFKVLSTIGYDTLTHDGFKLSDKIDSHHTSMKLMIKE